MPRFLNAWTGEFEWHNDPRTIRYAILSHVWQTAEEGGEQSYDDVRKIQAGVTQARRKPRFSRFAAIAFSYFLHAHAPPTPHAVSNIFSDGSPLSHKIKSLCKVAREAGYRLVWDDTCCIDKSSSAELSEAINSMYEWYRLSDICYVYLADVPDGDIPQRRDSAFRRSRWHKRGWTLQELIAPERIEFLSQPWTFLGTKLALALPLAEITGVDFDILTGRAAVDSASVARRMSWAAERETTRVEDRAYALMGLFGVHMPPIYGEGENAFLRLQEDIIRSVPDQSVFAWGDGCILRSLAQCEFVVNEITYHNYSDHHPSLLAPSPSYFGGTGAFRPITPHAFASRLRLKGTEDGPPLHCVFTPQGVRVTLLCLNITALPQVLTSIRASYEADACGACLRLGQPDRLALLQCEDDDEALITLPLHPSSSSVTRGRGSPIGTHILSSDPCLWNHAPYHIVRLSREALLEALKYVSLVPVEVSILRHHRAPPQSKFLQRIESLPQLSIWPADHPSSASFDIAPWSIHSLHTLGFTVSPLKVMRSADEIAMEASLTLHVSHSQSSHSERLQTIRVRLTLSHRPGEWGWTYVTVPHFSVTNSLADTRGSASSHGASRSSTNAADATTEATCLDDTPKDTLHPPSDVEYKSLKIAQAAFLVPSSLQARRRMRLLRLSLERLPDGAASPGAPCVWLSLEMTEEFNYITAANDDSGYLGAEGDGDLASKTNQASPAPDTDFEGDPFLPSSPST